MLKKILKVIAFIAITLTLIPIFAFDFWWIRMFDFPHVQLTVITLLAILIYYIKFSFKSYGDLAIISILITCFAFQVYKVRMFMPFYESEVKSEKLTDTSKSISFLTSNVLQSNDNYDLLKNVIDSTEADIMLFTEVNEKWSLVNNENFHDLADFEGYKRSFRNLFGFEVEGVDYDQPIETEVTIPLV